MKRAEFVKVVERVGGMTCHWCADFKVKPIPLKGGGVVFSMCGVCADQAIVMETRKGQDPQGLGGASHDSAAIAQTLPTPPDKSL